MKKPRKKSSNSNSKTTIKLIYESELSDVTISQLVQSFSSWKDDVSYLPIFEVKSKILFPMEQTFVPIMKRKVMAFVYQVINSELLKSFDSSPKV